MPTDRKIARLRKLEDGRHEVLDSDGKPLGYYIPHEDLMRHIRQSAEDAERLSETFSEGTLSVDREVTRRMRAYMRETGADMGYAYKKVLASDPELAKRYHQAHTKPE